MTKFDFSSYIASVLSSFTGQCNVEALSGGYTNLTARATFNPPVSLQSRKLESVILKYAPPHVAIDPSQSLSVHRQVIEATALDIINGLEPRYTDISTVLKKFDEITVPELILHDEKNSVLWISDLGHTTALQVYLLSEDSDNGQVEATARNLGKLLAGLYHDTGIPPEDLRAVLASDQFRSDTAKYLSDLGKQAMLGAQISDAILLSERILHSMLQADEKEQRFGMGDFWPGSVLVKDMGGIGLIDWEYFGTSSASSELGMFIAHLHLHVLNSATSDKASKRVEAFVASMLVAFRHAVKETPSRSFLRNVLIAHGRELVNGVGFYLHRFKDDVSKLRVINAGARSLRAAGASETETDFALLTAGIEGTDNDTLNTVDKSFSILYR